MISTARCPASLRRSWRGWWAVAAFVGIVAPGTAVAEPLGEAQDAYLRKGIERYSAKDYEGAVRFYEQGLALGRHPDLLYALAQAERMRRRCERAVAVYQEFLDTGPPAAEAERAKANIARCVDEMPTPAPLAPAVPAPAPTPTPSPAAPVPSTLPPATTSDTELQLVGIGVMGTGVALLGFGTFFAARSSSDWDEVNEAAARGDTWSLELQETFERAESGTTASVVLFASGGVTLALGSFIVAVGAGVFSDEPAQASSARCGGFGFVPVGGGGKAVVGCAF